MKRSETPAKKWSDAATDMILIAMIVLLIAWAIPIIPLTEIEEGERLQLRYIPPRPNSFEDDPITIRSGHIISYRAKYTEVNKKLVSGTYYLAHLLKLPPSSGFGMHFTFNSTRTMVDVED